ncbi:glycosyltransferase [Sulfurisphaera tokodaii]|uniref:Glycosyltransferase n=2 Tax=Sulfurisphaera tokodaii TaxID=111955 RepID=Q96Y76_SULTO|nr:glycosyltransferase family 2 protein [Sulfurisphaera tokodaii]BAB67401.1 putative glycosyltransferase [Sulfurisphaera tokodaii str. 7]HII75113.1 glycosyltransferase family 2 protein [Sulfurisphaera tokodaii]
MLIEFLIPLPILADILLIYQIYKEVELKKINGDFNGFASVIIPIKGLDVNLEENIKSLLAQDYPRYEVIYVVDDYEDPSVPILKKYSVKIIKSEDVCSLCSGKIKAQLTGLKYASGNIIVFADSDTWYPSYWLKELVKPLSNFVATTVFSWPKPYKLTLRNFIRAGFWTFGFESQAVGGTFLWGGSMAFRRDFFDKYVIEELSKNWCDDCTLTRIAKERGNIGFIINAVPLNIFDERNLIKWSERQMITVYMYSRRGFHAFILLSVFMLVFLILSFLSPIYSTPLILWVLKNIIRGYRTGYYIIPAIASLFAIFYALILTPFALRQKYIFWRGNKYKV